MIDTTSMLTAKVRREVAKNLGYAAMCLEDLTQEERQEIVVREPKYAAEFLKDLTPEEQEYIKART